MSEGDSKRDKIYKRVKQDKKTHHIFDDIDQEQLADIIKQLGGKNGDAVSNKNQKLENIEAIESKDLKELRKEAVSERDIIELFERLNEFDLRKIAEKQNLYNIYLNKLRKYKYHPNFKKVLREEKYSLMIIDHLDYLSQKIIKEQKKTIDTIQLGI